MTPHLTGPGLLLLATLLAPLAAKAAGDHAHDAPAAAAGPALPRFTAESEAFELVGVVDGRQLTVYLDRHDDNAPVKDARVELELGTEKLALKPAADGEYTATLAQAIPDGTTAVTATVVAGTLTDLLASEIDVHGESHAHDDAAPNGRRYAIGAGAVLVLAALGLWIVQRRASQRRVAGGAL